MRVSSTSAQCAGRSPAPVAERRVLQLPLQLPDARAVGQGRVDVAGQLGQRAALLVVQLVGRAHPRELARQQDRHHAQVADDRQQQPAQALAVASGLTAGVQCPHRVGRIPAVEQADHRRLVVAQRQLVSWYAGPAGQTAMRPPPRLRRPRASPAHRGYRPAPTRWYASGGRNPALPSARAGPGAAEQAAPLPRDGSTRHPAGDGSAVHSIKQARQRPLH